MNSYNYTVHLLKTQIEQSNLKIKFWLKNKKPRNSKRFTDMTDWMVFKSLTIQFVNLWNIVSRRGEYRWFSVDVQQSNIIIAKWMTNISHIQFMKHKPPANLIQISHNSNNHHDNCLFCFFTFGIVSVQMCKCFRTESPCELHMWIGIV